tara:strand:- start:3225 stop:3491 length:267 start_codon:yes stop_codon:yes gene_type:complete
MSKYISKKRFIDRALARALHARKGNDSLMQHITLDVFCDHCTRKVFPKEAVILRNQTKCRDEVWHKECTEAHHRIEGEKDNILLICEV